MGGGRAGFSRVGRLGGRARVRRSHRFADRRGRARSRRRSRTPHRRWLSETVPTARAQPDDATLTQVLSGLKDEGYDGDVIIEEDGGLRCTSCGQTTPAAERKSAVVGKSV